MIPKIFPNCGFKNGSKFYQLNKWILHLINISDSKLNWDYEVRVRCLLLSHSNVRPEFTSLPSQPHNQKQMPGWGILFVRPASYGLGRVRRIFWISNGWAPGSMRDLKKIIQLESNQEKTTKIDLWHLHTGRCTSCIYIAHPCTHVLYTQHKREGEGKRGKRGKYLGNIRDFNTVPLRSS